jgi:hypothetical protein
MATPEITCVVDSKSRTGEGAVWDVAEQALYWVDIPAGRLYRFDPATGLWRHREGPAEPPLRLRQVEYDALGKMLYPRHKDHAPESVLKCYLDEARVVLQSARPPSNEPIDDLVSADFEHLRWFDLPQACLAGS